MCAAQLDHIIKHAFARGGGSRCGFYDGFYDGFRGFGFASCHQHEHCETDPYDGLKHGPIVAQADGNEKLTASFHPLIGALKYGFIVVDAGALYAREGMQASRHGE